MGKITDRQTFELVLPAFFAAFAMAGIMADPSVPVTSNMAKLAWKIGDSMTETFMERFKKLEESSGK